jgi:hypothetical protein
VQVRLRRIDPNRPARPRVTARSSTARAKAATHRRRTMARR